MAQRDMSLVGDKPVTCGDVQDIVKAIKALGVAQEILDAKAPTPRTPTRLAPRQCPVKMRQAPSDSEHSSLRYSLSSANGVSAAGRSSRRGSSSDILGERNQSPKGSPHSRKTVLSDSMQASGDIREALQPFSPVGATAVRRLRSPGTSASMQTSANIRERLDVDAASPLGSTSVPRRDVDAWLDAASQPVRCRRSTVGSASMHASDDIRQALESSSPVRRLRSASPNLQRAREDSVKLLNRSASCKAMNKGSVEHESHSERQHLAKSTESPTKAILRDRANTPQQTVVRLRGDGIANGNAAAASLGVQGAMCETSPTSGVPQRPAPNVRARRVSCTLDSARLKSVLSSPATEDGGRQSFCEVTPKSTQSPQSFPNPLCVGDTIGCGASPSPRSSPASSTRLLDSPKRSPPRRERSPMANSDYGAAEMKVGKSRAFPHSESLSKIHADVCEKKVFIGFARSSSPSSSAAGLDGSARSLCSRPGGIRSPQPRWR